MSDSEHYEYLCSILHKLTFHKPVSAAELADLASALGVKISDFLHYKEAA